MRLRFQGTFLLLATVASSNGIKSSPNSASSREGSETIEIGKLGAFSPSDEIPTNPLDLPNFAGDAPEHVGDTARGTKASRMLSDEASGLEPSLAPVGSPASGPVPTFVSTGPVITEGIKMRLHGIEPFGPYDTWIFANEYKAYVESYYKDKGAEATEIAISVTKMDPPLLGRRLRRGSPSPSRRMRQKVVTVTFNQESKYRLPPELSLGDFIHTPFRKTSDRDNFLTLMRNYDAFANLTAVSHLEIPLVSLEDEGPSVSSSFTDSKFFSIGLAVLVTVVAEILLLGCAYCVYSKRQKSTIDSYAGETEADSKKRSNRTEPSTPSTMDGDENASMVTGQWQPSVVAEEDGISTVADPAPPLGNSTRSLSDYASDDQTDLTTEYDYRKAFAAGGPDDSVVMSAVGDQSVFSECVSFAFAEDGSYIQQGGGGQKQGGETNRAPAKEKHINVYAPPGKLGIAMDKPDGWAPIIHSISDLSILKDQLKVGDRLVALNDQDVTGMSATVVSRLIARTIDLNRKLSVIRTIA